MTKKQERALERGVNEGYTHGIKQQVPYIKRMRLHARETTKQGLVIQNLLEEKCVDVTAVSKAAVVAIEHAAAVLSAIAEWTESD